MPMTQTSSRRTLVAALSAALLGGSAWTALALPAQPAEQTGFVDRYLTDHLELGTRMTWFWPSRKKTMPAGCWRNWTAG